MSAYGPSLRFPNIDTTAAIGFGAHIPPATVIKTATYGKEKFLAQPVYSRDFPPCKFCE